MRSKSIVVTGSTRGIGFGLAREFLKRGCSVTVVGRTQAAVDKAIGELGGGDHVTGAPADVSRRGDVQNVWNHAVATFGKVDIWINNAGIDLPRQPLWEVSEADVHRIVDINLHGCINGDTVAINGMLAQGFGYVWNMEGFGSNGMTSPGITPYGTTKYGLTYLTKSLIKELKGKPIGIGYLSPGIVITDLLVGDLSPEQLKKISRTYNILGDTVETRHADAGRGRPEDRQVRVPASPGSLRPRPGCASRPPASRSATCSARPGSRSRSRRRVGGGGRWRGPDGPDLRPHRRGYLGPTGCRSSRDRSTVAHRRLEQGATTVVGVLLALTAFRLLRAATRSGDRPVLVEN